MLVLDFDFKCIWFMQIGNLNGYGGSDLRFPWICCLCCHGCKTWFGVQDTYLLEIYQSIIFPFS